MHTLPHRERARRLHSRARPRRLLQPRRVEADADERSHLSHHLLGMADEAAVVDVHHERWRYHAAPEAHHACVRAVVARQLAQVVREWHGVSALREERAVRREAALHGGARHVQHARVRHREVECAHVPEVVEHLAQPPLRRRRPLAHRLDVERRQLRPRVAAQRRRAWHRLDAAGAADVRRVEGGGGVQQRRPRARLARVEERRRAGAVLAVRAVSVSRRRLPQQQLREQRRAAAREADNEDRRRRAVAVGSEAAARLRQPPIEQQRRVRRLGAPHALLVVADVVLQLGAARGVAGCEVAPRLRRLASAAMRLEEAEVERGRALPARRICAVHQSPLRLRHARYPPGLERIVVRAGLAATPRVRRREQQPEPRLLWPQPQRGQSGFGGGVRVASRDVQRGRVGVCCRVGRVDGEGAGIGAGGLARSVGRHHRQAKVVVHVGRVRHRRHQAQAPLVEARRTTGGLIIVSSSPLQKRRQCQAGQRVVRRKLERAL